MILASLAACTTPVADVRHEFWRGEVDGDPVYLGVVRSAGVDGAPATLRVQVDAPWMVYGGFPLEDAPPADLATLPFLACPVPHGVVFSVSGHWFVAWRVAGGTIASALPEVTGDDCPAAAFDPFAIAREAEDQRWCRLLDDAGHLEATASCIVNVDQRPGGGAWNPDLKFRFTTDPRHREALTGVAVDALLAPGAEIERMPLIEHTVLADEVLRALDERCAEVTCDPVALGRAQQIAKATAAVP
jgi:hypothetical protein